MRKIIASLALIAFIGVWIWAAGTIGTHITHWPRLAQLLFFVVAGIGWIAPLKPLFAWMNANEVPDED